MGVQILKNQGVTRRKPEGEDPGKKEPEFFEPTAETGSLRVGEVEDQVNDVPVLEAKLPQLVPDVGDDVRSTAVYPYAGEIQRPD
jgi:hypothetical protein